MIINKSDIPSEHNDQLLTYPTSLFPRIETSTKTPDGIHSLKERFNSLFRNSESLHSHTPIIAFCGVSGVGKSSLINCFVPGARQKVGAVSHTGQGQQTTTMALAHSTKLDGNFPLFIVDLPGLQKFGVSHIPSVSLANCFSDMATFTVNCRFADCTHTKEPGCAVREALEQGMLPNNRYKAYLRMREEIVAYEQQRKNP